MTTDWVFLPVINSPTKIAHERTPWNTIIRILASRSQWHSRPDSSDQLSSDVESLRQGTIRISKNKARAPYTILLVGETGVGKSSVLELIANVLAGNDIDHYNFDILDHANEQGGSNNQSQTNSARFYQFSSNNGMVVSVGICKRDM